MDAWDEKNRKERVDREHLRIENERLEILRRQEMRDRQDKFAQEIRDRERFVQERRSRQNRVANSSEGGGCLSVIFIIALIAAGIYYFTSGSKQNHAVHQTQQIQAAQNQNKSISPMREHDNQTTTNKNSHNSETDKSEIKTINKMF